MTLTLKPGELVLKPWTIIGQPTGRLDVGVHGTYPIAQFGAAEWH